VFTDSKRRILMVSLLAQVSMPLMAGAATPACRSIPAHELRLHIVNEAGAPQEALEIAATETSRIWDPIGLQLTWTFPPASPDAAGGRTVIVVIRRTLTPIPSVNVAATKGRVRTPLGWLVFNDQGQAGNLIEVSFDQVVALVRRGSQLNVPVTALPAFAREHTLGRGLGRVIAHEVGHWLMGRGHVETGLMKPRFHAQDLVDYVTPALPKAWMASGAECVPLALRRFAADHTSNN
jgi:hypothetical protein